MRKLIFIVMITFVSFSYYYHYPNMVFAVEKMPDNSRPEGEAVTDTTDVHYNGKYCLACHVETPRKGAKLLKYEGDSKQLCRCHYRSIVKDLHPVDIAPSEEKKNRMPDDFPLQNGKIECITCHDIFDQCREDSSEMFFTKEKRLFLRGQPYKDLKRFCFKCHNEIKFKKYNPHQQLNENGEIIGLKCLYCHKEIPDEKKESYDDVTLIGDLKPLCIRCHRTADKQTLHARHLRRPSNEVLTRIKQIEAEYNIVLPLSHDGEITCATCHNPHEKGVIPAEKAGAKGADEDRRHRLLENICMQCHQMR